MLDCPGLIEAFFNFQEVIKQCKKENPCLAVSPKTANQREETLPGQWTAEGSRVSRACKVESHKAHRILVGGRGVYPQIVIVLYKQTEILSSSSKRWA